MNKVCGRAFVLRQEQRNEEDRRLSPAIAGLSAEPLTVVAVMLGRLERSFRSFGDSNAYLRHRVRKFSGLWKLRMDNWGRLRLLTTLTILIPILSLCACEPRPSSTVIKQFESGITFEELLDVHDGVRVVSMRKNGGPSGEIIVPGMVVWCESRGRLIVGEKTSEKKPAEWMDDDWEKRSGFFILDPRQLNMEDPAANESVERAIRWFATTEDFEDGLAAIETERETVLTSIEVRRSDVTPIFLKKAATWPQPQTSSWKDPLRKSVQ